MVIAAGGWRIAGENFGMSGRRTDTGSRVIHASPSVLYWAHLTPQSVARWRAPKGMTGEVLAFEARPGGRFRMAFVYDDPERRGKTSGQSDVFEGEFADLIPGRRIVERIQFESPDPALAGVMTIITTFTPVTGGTRVDVRIEDVPPGIGEADHAEGIRSSLENLARFTEPFQA
jgi:uncharacterized protein YndB with AHSA1/START domain